MAVTVGTFNLNNLFSRYNFKGEIDKIAPDEAGVGSEVKYVFGPDSSYRIRTYQGKLVTPKPSKDTETIAQRIKSMNLDVLAVQEVEDIDTLKGFNKEYIDGMYPYTVLVEGNDQRLIDVAILSKFPIGAVISWQKAVHPTDPSQPVFGRDLLEIEILNNSRSQKLFTLFNNHLKSHYSGYGEDREKSEQSSNKRRSCQAEVAAQIIRERAASDPNFIVVGDMNDPPDSSALQPLVGDTKLNLVNALANAHETQPPKKDTPPPASQVWTHRYKEAHKPAQYQLYDQIWLSPSLKEKLIGAWINRRKNLTGDGSDHDPAWIELEL